jgi:hypothetical protein
MLLSYKTLIFSAAMIGVGVVSYYQQYSFSRALDYYGFTTKNQKQALKSLLQQADTVVVGSTLDELFFRSGGNQEQLAKDLATIVAETQKKFFLRNGGKERWEVEGLAWMQQNKEQTLAHLKTLGFVDASVTSCKKFDALCILGGTRARMAQRIDYAESFMAQGGKANIVILLGGERYVTMGLELDGPEDALRSLAERLGIVDWHNLTETHIMKDIYGSSALQERGLMLAIIDTPRGDLPRPTTQTTIMELIHWLQQHPDVKSILFFSTQPYVLYQKAIISAILSSQKVTIKFEVIGPSTITIHDLYAALEGLGSYFWAATPEVLQNMKINIAQDDLKQQMETLYGKNPLLYQTIPFA